MNRIVELIKIPFIWLVQLGVRLFHFGVDFFFSLSLWGRIILILTVGGIASVILPVASFEIFSMDYPVNNPLSIQLICIVILLDVSVLFRGLWVLIAREALIVYYLLHFLLIFITGHVTRAEPHTLASGFYVNIVMIVLYGLFCALDYLDGGRA